MNRFGRCGVKIDYCAAFKNILNFPVLLTPAGRGVLTLLKMRPQNQLPVTRDAPELKIKGFLRVSHTMAGRLRFDTKARLPLDPPTSQLGPSPT